MVVRKNQSRYKQEFTNRIDFHIFCPVFHADSRGSIHFPKINYCSVIHTKKKKDIIKSIECKSRNWPCIKQTWMTSNQYGVDGGKLNWYSIIEEYSSDVIINCKFEWDQSSTSTILHIEIGILWIKLSLLYSTWCNSGRLAETKIGKTVIQFDGTLPCRVLYVDRCLNKRPSYEFVTL